MVIAASQFFPSAYLASWHLCISMIITVMIKCQNRMVQNKAQPRKASTFPPNLPAGEPSGIRLKFLTSQPAGYTKQIMGEWGGRWKPHTPTDVTWPKFVCVFFFRLIRDCCPRFCVRKKILGQPLSLFW